MSSYWDLDEGSSKLEELLASESPALDAILDEPEVIQELRGGNQALCSFMSRVETIKSCVNLALYSPVGAARGMKGYSRLHAASEVLNVQSDAVYTSLATYGAEVVPLIVPFAMSPAESTDDVKAGFFAKLTGVFVRACPQHLNQSTLPSGFFSALLERLSNCSFMEAARMLFDVPIPSNNSNPWYVSPKSVIQSLLAKLESSPDADDAFYFHLQELFVSLILRSHVHLKDCPPLVATALKHEFLRPSTLTRLMNVLNVTTNSVAQRAVAASVFERLLWTRHPDDQTGLGGQAPMWNLPPLTLEERMTAGLLSEKERAVVSSFLLQHVPRLEHCFHGRCLGGFNKVLLTSLAKVLVHLGNLDPFPSELRASSLVSTVLHSMRAYHRCTLYMNSINRFVCSGLRDASFRQTVLTCGEIFPCPSLPRGSPFFGSYFMLLRTLKTYGEDVTSSELWRNDIESSGRLDQALAKTSPSRFSAKQRLAFVLLGTDDDEVVPPVTQAVSENTTSEEEEPEEEEEGEGVEGVLTMGFGEDEPSSGFGETGAFGEAAPGFGEEVAEAFVDGAVGSSWDAPFGTADAPPSSEFAAAEDSF